MKLMAPCLWWGKMILIGLISILFLIFGIETLIGAFYLQNPLEFIMYFFSASFIILISVVGVLYPSFQIYIHFRTERTDHNEK